MGVVAKRVKGFQVVAVGMEGHLQVVVVGIAAIVRRLFGGTPSLGVIDWTRPINRRWAR